MGSDLDARHRPPTPLHRQLLDHLDLALLVLGRFEEDPRTAAAEARISIERAEAVLILLEHLDPPTARGQRRNLRGARRLLGPLLEHRSRLRPDAPPPLAPLARAWVQEVTARLTVARLELDLPQWHTPVSLPAVRSSAVTTYAKARKRWRGERSQSTRVGGRGPTDKTLRAERRVRFQVEALCRPGRLTTDGRYRSIIEPDLTGFFSLTPADHGRWLTELCDGQDQAEGSTGARSG